MDKFGDNNDLASALEQVRELQQGQDILTQCCKDLRKDTWEEISQIKINLNTKAGLEDMEALKKQLLDELMNSISRLKDIFAPKDDTSKKINQLSKRLKELYEYMQNSGGSQDDGLLTKRKLGPNACASCDKDLVNLQGQKVDFSAHKKMPQRDANNSMSVARYGSGFSKILSTLQPSTSNVNIKQYLSPQNVGN